MLSSLRLSEIVRITQEMLDAVEDFEVIDRVTVIRGYAMLLTRFPQQKEYADKVLESLIRLADIADHHYLSNLSNRMRRLALETVEARVMKAHR